MIRTVSSWRLTVQAGFPCEQRDAECREMVTLQLLRLRAGRLCDRRDVFHMIAALVNSYGVLES
jgi:hypothetical protein